VSSYLPSTIPHFLHACLPLVPLMYPPPTNLYSIPYRLNDSPINQDLLLKHDVHECTYKHSFFYILLLPLLLSFTLSDHVFSPVGYGSEFCSVFLIHSLLMPHNLSLSTLSPPSVKIPDTIYNHLRIYVVIIPILLLRIHT